LLFDHGQFAAQDFRQKIAVTAGRFQKAAVDAFGFLFDLTCLSDKTLRPPMV
jgi:hypothetical protein